MPGTELPQRIEAVRRFNRFYTRQIGLLRDGLWRSPFTLTEARVVFDLAHQEQATATQLSQQLGIDAGYLSRVVSRLRAGGLIRKRRSPSDRRQALLSLTRKGEAAFATINAASRDEVGALLDPLSAAQQQRLVEAMSTIEHLLGGGAEHRVPYVLRPHQSGDIGWIIHRHGVLYRQEYGWDEAFEALVAEIAARFLSSFDARRERCWIAEREGEIVGSVFLVRHPEHDAVAKLRLLLVEPKARGLGIGTRLVQECTRFARHAGYAKITLWTNDVLHAARRLYEAEGYRLVHEEPHQSFGHDLVGQTWELTL